MHQLPDEEYIEKIRKRGNTVNWIQVIDNIYLFNIHLQMIFIVFKDSISEWEEVMLVELVGIVY